MQLTVNTQNNVEDAVFMKKEVIVGRMVHMGVVQWIRNDFQDLNWLLNC